MAQRITLALSVFFLVATICASVHAAISGNITFPNAKNKDFKTTANIAYTFDATGLETPESEATFVVAIRKNGASGIIDSSGHVVTGENPHGAGELSPPPGDVWALNPHTIYLILGEADVDTFEVTIVP